MPAKSPKGPIAPSESVSVVDGHRAAPHEAGATSKTAAGLSAAFQATLGAKLPEPHLRLAKPNTFDSVAQAKAGPGGKAPRPAPVRSSMICPRSGHK